MKKHLALIVCALLAGCAADSNAPKTAQAERYRCESDIAFTARFSDDSAVIDSNRGYEVLYRPIRGQASGPATNPKVYGNIRLRAEFGLGSAGSEANLTFLLNPLVVRCVRD